MLLFKSLRRLIVCNIILALLNIIIENSFVKIVITTYIIASFIQLFNFVNTIEKKFFYKDNVNS
ncbi:hypothetical protein [Caloranaerobacter ferrireducens]|uniref:hypothetical protein n=1 Tax=Caloranaerobacter ferrireducens TaxID=1323370 RepID=UPI00084DE604|nr:hypothetical protein [Caloranaerobacter ferrireducens]